MKKFLAALVVAFMMCSALTCTAFAKSPVISPEVPDDPNPEDEAPQTGYENGIAGVAAIALACGAVAVVSVRKARQYRS